MGGPAGTFNDLLGGSFAYSRKVLILGLPLCSFCLLLITRLAGFLKGKGAAVATVRRWGKIPVQLGSLTEAQDAWHW